MRERPKNTLETLTESVDWLQANCRIARPGGSISATTAGLLDVCGLGKHVSIGDFVKIETQQSIELGEVVAANVDLVRVKPLSDAARFRLGGRVWHFGPQVSRPSSSWKNRTLNALSVAIDDQGPLEIGETAYSLTRQPPAALKRERIVHPVCTGVKVVDAFTPLCFGQRVGLFAGSGVGKSTLLTMLARAPGFDTVVLGLIGERGREVNETLEILSKSQSANCITVVSSSDESPTLRRLAAYQAMTIAEYFRDQGERVLLLVDSFTRFAHASRELALASGELPVARGYPPSVLSEIPRLLERAGTGCVGSGSITAIVTVLMDGDDHADPVVDTIRGTLDGHIIMDRRLAEQGQFPAIDPIKSISRLAPTAWTEEQSIIVNGWRRALSRYEETSDLRMMGGVKAGVDADLDLCISLAPRLYSAIAQLPDDPISTNAIGEISLWLEQHAQ